MSRMLRVLTNPPGRGIAAKEPPDSFLAQQWIVAPQSVAQAPPMISLYFRPRPLRIAFSPLAGFQLHLCWEHSSEFHSPASNFPWPRAPRLNMTSRFSPRELPAQGRLSAAAAKREAARFPAIPPEVFARSRWANRSDPLHATTDA